MYSKFCHKTLCLLFYETSGKCSAKAVTFLDIFLPKIHAYRFGDAFITSLRTIYYSADRFLGIYPIFIYSDSRHLIIHNIHSFLPGLYNVPKCPVIIITNYSFTWFYIIMELMQIFVPKTISSIRTGHF